MPCFGALQPAGKRVLKTAYDAAQPKAAAESPLSRGKAGVIPAGQMNGAAPQAPGRAPSLRMMASIKHHFVSALCSRFAPTVGAA
jgi:hypothetical protein